MLPLPSARKPATLLLDSGTPIADVQELLDHKNIQTTRGYKRKLSVDQSASHEMPL